MTVKEFEDLGTRLGYRPQTESHHRCCVLYWNDERTLDYGDGEMDVMKYDNDDREICYWEWVITSSGIVHTTGVGKRIKNDYETVENILTKFRNDTKKVLKQYRKQQIEEL